MAFEPSKLTDDELQQAANELDKRGYFVFVAVPDQDFIAEVADLDDVMEGMNTAFYESHSIVRPEDAT